MLDLGVARYQPFRARSYFPMPKSIPQYSVITMKNDDNRCFEWAIISDIYPVDHGRHQDRTAEYRNHLGKLNFQGIDFPVKVTDIGRFERQHINMSFNVFGWNKGLYPIHISDASRTNNVDILLLVSGENQHYVYIKNLSMSLL